MKHILTFFAIFSLIMLSGCNFAERDKQLTEREKSLSQREQELLLKEKDIQVREHEISLKEQSLDSTKLDSTFIYNAELVGTWSVKMECKETSCSGFAIGDTKTETWDIRYHDKLVIAKVMTNNAGHKLLRVYTGYYTGEVLQLANESTEGNPDKTTLMTVRLKFTTAGQMEGQREINRQENCRILFSIKLNKQ